MNYKAKDYGGGPATGLANDFTKFLQQAITTGSFGGGTAGQQAANANPMGSTGDIMGVLNSILQGPSADYMSSVNQMISKENENNVAGVRARFGAGGGTAFGTPAAYAEGVVRAENAPRQAMAFNDIMNQNKGMALQMLLPMFNMMAGISQKGISQRETTLQPPAWVQGLNLGMDVANTVSGFIPFAGGGGGGKSTAPINSGTPVTSDNSPMYSMMPELMPPMMPLLYG